MSLHSEEGHKLRRSMGLPSSCNNPSVLLAAEHRNTPSNTLASGSKSNQSLCLVFSWCPQWLHCPVGSQDPASPPQKVPWQPSDTCMHLSVNPLHKCGTCVAHISCSHGSHIFMRVCLPHTTSLTHSPCKAKQLSYTRETPGAKHLIKSSR